MQRAAKWLLLLSTLCLAVAFYCSLTRVIWYEFSSRTGYVTLTAGAIRIGLADAPYTVEFGRPGSWSCGSTIPVGVAAYPEQTVGTIGGVRIVDRLIPLWLLLLPLGLPTIVLWYRDRRRSFQRWRPMLCLFAPRTPCRLTWGTFLIGCFVWFLARAIARVTVERLRQDGLIPFDWQWPSWASKLLSAGWPLFGLMFALAIVRVRNQLRRIAFAGQSCAACGYNLTGNTSGRCPECGAPTACADKPSDGRVDN